MLLANTIRVNALDTILAKVGLSNNCRWPIDDSEIERYSVENSTCGSPLKRTAYRNDNLVIVATPRKILGRVGDLQLKAEVSFSIINLEHARLTLCSRTLI